MTTTAQTKIIPHHIPALKTVSTASQLVNNNKLNSVILYKVSFFIIVYFLVFSLNSVMIRSPVFDRSFDLVSGDILLKRLMQKLFKFIIISKSERCNLGKA